jgi:hypothetical protein
MNEPDRVEEALKKLQPSELPPHLMARLTAARPQAAQQDSEAGWRGIIFRWLLPLAASACVAVVTFFFLERNRPAAGPDHADVAIEQEPQRVESQEFLVAARPVGIVVAPNQRPYRIMDVEWLEYETVRAGADGPLLHTATKRRDVVPVALEVY